MSAPLLQRVVVRMLHDPELRAAVYADAATALAGIDLSAAERAWLVRSDARAWSVDVQRAERVLTALIEEMAVSVLVLMEDGVVFARLRRFFQSAFFHGAIMARGSLAPAFAAFLGTVASRPRARSMIAVDAAIARVRRDGRARAVAVAAGTSASWERAKQALGADPLASLRASKRPRVATVDAKATEWLLIALEGDPAEPVVSFIGEALGRLLQAAERPMTRDALIAMAMSEGAEAAEATELVDALIADGTVHLA